MDTNHENQNKKRLGRGLNSLFAESPAKDLDYSKDKSEPKGQEPPKVEAPVKAATPEENDSKVWKIAIDKLVPGIYQPRRTFNKETIQQLADSIKQNGLLQPITVRKRTGGGYEIVAGERRWRASQVAGLHEVPAIIKTISDQEALQLAIIENVQREDLDAIEEAEGYQRLMTEFNYSQLEVSEKVGKERSTVANALRLITLPTEIKDMISDKQISAGHAKALLALTDKAAMLKLARETSNKGWSVRALEVEIKNKAKTVETEAHDKLGSMNVASKLAQELADQLQKKLGTKTEINYKAGKGQVILHFYSDDQLTQIYEKLNK